MLVEVANDVLKAGGDLHAMRIFSQEKILTTASIARTNLLLCDMEDARVMGRSVRGS
jgi:hypothetical protein